MTQYTKRLLVICKEDCHCHNGARYDQIECMCEWFCGEPAENELIEELQKTKSVYEVVSI